MALDAAQGGICDAICFAPLNKHSLHEAAACARGRAALVCEQLGVDGPVCEFNVLDGLWTSRISSHVPLRTSRT